MLGHSEPGENPRGQARSSAPGFPAKLRADLPQENAKRAKTSREADIFCAPGVLSRLKSLGFVALGSVLAGAAFAQRMEFSWPTPNHAWEQGRDYSAWVQPTVSGEPESGLFGCVRSSGSQFHEGLDIRAIGHDRRGEATDTITAAMDGIVRHVNTSPGNSN
jgi:hypothetical protein